MEKRRKLETFNKENCEKLPGRNLPQNTFVPRSNEGFITQVSQETEGRVTMILSKIFSRTEIAF